MLSEEAERLAGDNLRITNMATNSNKQNAPMLTPVQFGDGLLPTISYEFPLKWTARDTMEVNHFADGVVDYARGYRSPISSTTTTYSGSYACCPKQKEMGCMERTEHDKIIKYLGSWQPLILVHCAPDCCAVDCKPPQDIPNYLNGIDPCEFEGCPPEDLCIDMNDYGGICGCPDDPKCCTWMWTKAKLISVDRDFSINNYTGKTSPISYEFVIGEPFKKVTYWNFRFGGEPAYIPCRTYSEAEDMLCRAKGDFRMPCNRLDCCSKMRWYYSDPMRFISCGNIDTDDCFWADGDKTRLIGTGCYCMPIDGNFDPHVRMKFNSTTTIDVASDVYGKAKYRYEKGTVLNATNRMAWIDGKAITSSCKFPKFSAGMNCVTYHGDVTINITPRWLN